MGHWTWTPARVEQLKALWAEGRAASYCAMRLGGVSRNAVIGKVHRLGLPKRNTASLASPKKKRRADGQLVKKLRELRNGSILPSAPCEETRRGEGCPPTLDPPLHYLLFEQLEKHSCRWPEGEGADKRFCGAHRKAHSPYCAHHHSRAYEKPKAAQRGGFRLYGQIAADKP